MRIVLCLMVLSCVLVAAGGVADANQWMESRSLGFANAQREHLEELADPAKLAKGGDKPIAWLRLTEYMWRFVHYTGYAWPTWSEKAIENVLPHVRKAHEADPDHRDWRLAYTYALMAKYRLAQMHGDREYHPDWVEAATWLGSEEHIAGDAGFGMRGSFSLLEAMVGSKADAEALTAQARAMLDAVLAKTGGDEAKATLLASWHTAAAKAHLLRKKKGDAKLAVAAGVEALAPFMAKPSDEVAKVHGELAIVALAGKLKVKGAALRTQTRRNGASGLQLTIPKSPLWTFEATKEQREAFRVYRHVGTGARYYEIVVTVWPDDTRLTNPNGVTLPVTDTKGGCEAAAETPEGTFAVVDMDGKVRVKKGKIGRGFSDVYTFTIDGHRADSTRRRRVMVWMGRNKKLKRVVRVMVSSGLGEDLDDGMIDWLFSQLVIAKRKK